MSRLTGGDPDRGLVEVPRWVGMWPAAVGLFAFVWLEPVSPDTSSVCWRHTTAP
ncbi:MAG: hypothetical protein H0V42_11020 [Nocardioidaceae bacterium]|nr:hypothetical protein [Nocardioidaceae bacterium]